MRQITVRTASSSYEAVVGSGLLRDFVSLLPKRLHECRCAIVCDTNTRRFAEAIARQVEGDAPSSLHNASQAMTEHRPPAVVVCIGPGEQSKSLEQVGVISDKMIATNLDRTAFVIGVGGGVVGDISGFVAAIFERGIPHVQVPTTLLAMVDSSIGGKTAVNTRAGKNLLGAVHQPSLIVADIETLQTLPERELRQGFAEIVKHGIIRDPAMLDRLRDFSMSFRADGAAAGAEEEFPKTRGFLDPFDFAQGKAFARNEIERLIARNIEIKAAIVAADERDETGQRALLNFGHTIGHAIERAAGYGTMLHGEAISIGIVAACDVSVARAGFSQSERDAVVSLLRSFGLPTSLPSNVDRGAVLDAVRCDKKFTDGKVRFVVTPRLGEAYLSRDVSFDDIRDAVAHL